MLVNKTRERLAKCETVFGCGLQCYRSAEIPRAFAAAGFDYVFIDMEHGSYKLETGTEKNTATVQGGGTPLLRGGGVGAGVFDYVFIDMEHGSYNLETVHDMITASLQAGITPIVRVAELAYSL